MPRFRKVAVRYSPGNVDIHEISRNQSGELQKPASSLKSHDEFKDWLATIGTSNNRTEDSKIILRMVHIQCEFVESAATPSCLVVPLSKLVCSQAQQSLGLPCQFLDMVDETSNRIVRLVDEEGVLPTNEYNYIFNYKADPSDHNSAMLIINHKPALVLTTGLLLSSNRKDEQENKDIRDGIIDMLTTTTRASMIPMLLPMILADMIVSFEATANGHVDATLNELEATNRRMLHDNADYSLLDKLKYTARTLNEMRNSIGRSETRLKNLQHLFSVCAQIAVELKAAPHGQSQLNVASAHRVLSGHANNLESDAHHLLLQLANHHTRVQNQQSVVGLTVYNFMAQREAISSQQIAAASMKDGAAMKALALLTTVFLPGTYLATLFSMPFIDFTTGVTDLPGGVFGLYWGITVLLTGFVIGTWALWMWREAKIRSRKVSLVGK